MPAIRGTQDDMTPPSSSLRAHAVPTCRRSPNQGKAVVARKGQPLTLVIMQAAAKPTRVLISRHTCTHTGRTGSRGGRVGSTRCPASTLLRALLGMWGCSLSPPSPGSQERTANWRLLFCPGAFCWADGISA